MYVILVVILQNTLVDVHYVKKVIYFAGNNSF
jgi:hypothetical protein